jgi:hypothetical protein
MKKPLLLIVLIVFASIITACKQTATQEDSSKTNGTTAEKSTNSGKEVAPKAPKTELSEDGYVVSESGNEKEKPESGKANVQGKALFNEKPVAGVEAKLCEKFSTFMGCSGKQYTTKTDATGEYFFKGVEPKDYEGLIVRVFETKSYVFASQGFGIMAAKYKIEADKTFFAPVTNLFKSDIKITNPKSGSKSDSKTLEIKWDAYPDAAYYKISMFAEEASITSPYISTKVEEALLKIEKPMDNGEYRLEIEAYNANDVKLSGTKNDYKINLTGGEEMPANK